MKYNVSVLLANDPESAAKVLQSALSGDMDAQFVAGLLYAEGRGVPLDRIQSFFWLTRALEQGDTDAERLRCIVGSQMSDHEFAQAEKLLRLEAEVALNSRIKNADINRQIRH